VTLGVVIADSGGWEAGSSVSVRDEGVSVVDIPTLAAGSRLLSVMMVGSDGVGATLAATLPSTRETSTETSGVVVGPTVVCKV
jgi:hypothetical protein